MKHRYTRTVCALAVLSIFHAQAEETVVVTAARQPQLADEVLADVTVLERADIEQAGQSTLTELLARQPGLQMSTNGGPGASASIYMRGAEARHTLVLIDGMRVSSATLGQPSLENIPLAEIDRVEILRGPAAALYGSEAIGGVIQIFTRRGQGQPRFDAFVGYGGYNTREGDVGYSGANGALSYSVRAGVYDSDGFSATYDRTKQPFSYNPDKDGFSQRHASANLALKLSETDELGLDVLQSDGTNQYDNGNTRFDDRIRKTLESYQAHLRNQFTSAWTSTLRMGRGSDHSTTVGRTGNSVFTTDQDQLQWQNDINLPLGRALLAYEYTEQSVGGTTAYTVRKRHVDSLQAGWNASIDSHRIQLNVRRDDNSQFGAKTTGLASYGYQFSPQWRAYVSTGTAFNAPTFNQLYFPSFGNPKLGPELSRNHELGIVWDGTDQNASVTYFNNRVTDLITTICNPITFACQPVNVGRARLEGVTLAYGAHYGAWQANASLDLMQARNDITQRHLPNRADQQAQLSLSRQWNGLRVGAELSASGMRYDNSVTRLMGGYAIVNAFANWQMLPDWSLEVRANNIGDRPYETARGFAMPGATLFAGLRYTPH